MDLRIFRYLKTAFLFTVFSLALVAAALLCGHFLSLESGETLFAMKNEKQPTASPSDLPFTVVLDAGHGGIDGGAISADGTVLEKDLNLAVAGKLASLLALSDVKVVMTRTEDVLLAGEENTGHRKRDDLLARQRLAEAEENAVFVSIHMNQFPVAKYNGLQVYYSPNHPDSKAIAEEIQKRTAAVLQPQNKREVKKADSSIFLLSRLQMPAVLIECGFLSNPEEAQKLSDPLYQNELAAVLFAALTDALPTTP